MTKNTEVAFLAVEGIAHAAEFLAALYERLPEGENKDAVRSAGLSLIGGGEHLLDMLEDDTHEATGDEDGSEEGVSRETLSNEVVAFAGISFMADTALRLIAANTHDDAARRTAQSAVDVIAQAVAEVSEQSGEREGDEGYEAVERSVELAERARVRAEEIADEDEAADAAFEAFAA